MNQAQHKTSFETSDGTKLALEGMSISGVLRNAFAVIEMVQTYRNAEAHNIEAVYSFPLPVEATLLHLSVRLNDTLLLGRVAERQKAEAEYEEAVASGDSAVMLEQVEPGLYAMNVGNLMAGERATVTMRYALPLRWEGRQLRLALPTTIAPRYGDELKAGVQPHQAPAPDLMTEHTYSLALRILGSMGEAAVASPSHMVSVQKIEQGLEVVLAAGRAYADRDLVLTLHAQGEPASAMTVVPDGDGQLAHGAFRIPDRQGQRDLALKILVDCSGSMAGDSIALARAGALHALHSLTTGDRFSVSAFGSKVEHDPRFEGMLMPGGVDPTISMASDYVGQLDANMGGTEMLRALKAVFSLNKASDGELGKGGEVLLITDGETWDRDAIVQACRKSGHRIFVIGIGSSPAEAVVRQVAESTGGAAAFVSPREDITPVVERHLRRMRMPRVTSARLDLPGEIVWQSPARLDGSVFPGDTLHVFCGLKNIREGAARLAVRYADGTACDIEAGLERLPADTLADADLPRIAAAARIRESVFESGEERRDELTALAVQHQVISPFTNYILIHVRGEDAATKLPELRQVRSMLAAGWGGFGSVRGSRISLSCGVTEFREEYPIAARVSARQEVMFSLSDAPDVSLAPLAFLRRGTMAEVKRMVDDLELLISQGWPEEEVLIAFWLALLDSPLEKLVARAHRRAILRAARQAPVAADLVQWIAAALVATTDMVWNWAPPGDFPAAPAADKTQEGAVNVPRPGAG